MKPRIRTLSELCNPHHIRGLLFDIDETLTTEGKLTAQAYSAMEKLKRAGKLLVAITGRPAGWCDHIARLWPVDGVVGENGAFYFYFLEKKLIRRYHHDEQTRAVNRPRLEVIGKRIAALMRAPGLSARISSIHVNGWFGDYDKLAMTQRLLAEVFKCDAGSIGQQFAFVGDSPNDAPMFAHFENSVGVANLARFDGRLESEPRYLTRGAAGAGFAELAARLLGDH